MEAALQKLQTEGVAMIPYNQNIREIVERAAASWQSFCGLPLEEKQRYGALGSMVGYEYKDGSGPQGDRKENFDITTGIQLENVDVAPAFIHDTVAISKALSQQAIRFAQQVEDAYTVPELTARTEQSTDQIFTRFIHYFGDQPAGTEIATPHCDQSGYTFHLFETAGGCQRLDYTTREWVDMPVAAGKMAAFPAMQLQLLSGGELRALSHRVIATEETSRVGRYAIVCFVRLKNTPEYDKATHGRLQEFEPGFNYDLSPNAFAELFV